MGALLSGLNASHDGYQLRVADALWAQQGNPFLDDFLQLMKNDYGAGFNRVDFKDAAEAARLTINKWVEEKTDDKIMNMLQPGVLSPQTRLVLTNAIYFKGPGRRNSTRHEQRMKISIYPRRTPLRRL